MAKKNGSGKTPAGKGAPDVGAETGKTLVTLLLDRSGSMQSLKGDTLGAIAAYLGELRKAEGRMLFSLVQFDAHGAGMDLARTHVARPIAEVEDLKPEDFTPRGTTPLIDAACATIRAVEDSLKDREDVKIVIAIQTDGHENASRENKWEDLRALVAEKEAKGWEFLFMGAGINAFNQGSMMGISAEKTISYGKDAAKTRAAFAATGENIAMFASGVSASTRYSATQKHAAGEGDLVSGAEAPNDSGIGGWRFPSGPLSPGPVASHPFVNGPVFPLVSPRVLSPCVPVEGLSGGAEGNLDLCFDDK